MFRKQFCPNGHDKTIVGVSSGRCKQCRRDYHSINKAKETARKRVWRQENNATMEAAISAEQYPRVLVTWKVS